MSALPPKANKFSSIERGQATRSSLELACDKFLDHLTRLVGLRTRFRDPFVNTIFEQAIVALAAGRSVGLGDVLLEVGEYGMIEGALHDEERHQGDLFLALENFLRVGFVDRLPRIEEHLVVFNHTLVAAPHSVFVARKGVADRRTRGSV